MPIRGRPYYSNVRRRVAPASIVDLLGISVGADATPETDADRLIASFRLRAYSEARQRQRQAQASETAAHWGAVARLIARRTGERRGDEPSAPDSAPGVESQSPASPFRSFEVDPLDELERILAVKPQWFRLQFFGAAADHGPMVLAETEIEATDASGAIRAAVQANWPVRAVGLRVLDIEGREIFERLKADLR